MKNLLLFVLGASALLSCRRDEGGAWQPTDLLPYGLPVTILAPDSVKASTRDWGGGLIQDVTLRGPDGFDLQIYASDAQTNDIARIKAEQLAEVKANRFFSRILEEEEAGFLYEIRLDSSQVYYGFRFIYLQGDKEYVFQPGLSALLSLDETRRLYEAVQPRRRRK